MKKLVVSIVILFFPFCVNATGGTLVQKSVRECSDGNLYGYHSVSGVKHYHIAVKNESGTYVASSKDSLGESNPCKDKIETEKVILIFDECVDGDTAKFILNDKKIKVRFLAVDTPETVDPDKEPEPYGKEASNYTCDKIKNANEIILEYDPGSDKTDKYDRYLGWIYVDGEMLQKELITLGYAKVAYLYGDYLYTEELKDLEEIAKKDKKGIWGDYEEKFDYLTIAISLVALLIVLYEYFKKGKSKWKKLIKKI